MLHDEFSDGPHVNHFFYILEGLRAWGTQDLVRKSQSQLSPELSSYVEAFYRDKRNREGLHSSRLLFKDMTVFLVLGEHQVEIHKCRKEHN